MQVKMKHGESTTSKGRTYYYYRRDGKRWGRLRGEPGSTQWLADYHRIHATFERLPSLAIPGTFEDAVTRYLKSPDYKRLAEATRKQYRIYLDRLRAILGPYNIEDIQRVHIKDIRDQYADQPGTANVTVRVAGALFQWALDAYELPVNPAAGIKAFPIGEYDAWPEPAIERFFATAPQEVAWVVAFALYTGQRKGDILRVRWDALEGGGINFKQQKTGRALWVPMHPDLATVVDALPKRGTVMLTTQTGRAWSITNFDDAFSRARNKAGCQGLVFHGLRKTAASRLAECGCTTEEIKSITGHASDQMASFYAKGADQKRKARAAIAKLAKLSPKSGGK